MKRHKPIGCNSHHFVRQVGQDKVCMYCGEVFLKFVTIEDKSTGYKYTMRPLIKFNE